MPKFHKGGFTLVELMIVVSIVGVLATIGAVTYSNTQKIARDARRKADLKQIQGALVLFQQDFKRYPCSGTAEQTSNSVNWLSDSSSGSCGTGAGNLVPNYTTKVPKDPSTNNSGNLCAPGNFGYCYYSTDAATFGSCSKNQYYLLVTHLENTTDPDRLEVNAKTVCGNSLTTATYGNNAYIISYP